MKENQLEKDLKMFAGLPPYDGFNTCKDDSWFYESIKRNYGLSDKEVVSKIENLRIKILREKKKGQI